MNVFATIIFILLLFQQKMRIMNVFATIIFILLLFQRILALHHLVLYALLAILNVTTVMVAQIQTASIVHPLGFCLINNVI